MIIYKELEKKGLKPMGLLKEEGRFLKKTGQRNFIKSCERKDSNQWEY